MSTLDNIEHHLQFIPTDAIKSIHPDIPIATLKRNLKEFLKENRHKNPKKRPIVENSKHFPELVLAVEDLHKILEKKKSRYRFCIYLEEGEVMIDILVLDKDGKKVNVMKKDITHEDFIKWFEDLETGTGILFDSTA